MHTPAPRPPRGITLLDIWQPDEEEGSTRRQTDSVIPVLASEKEQEVTPPCRSQLQALHSIVRLGEEDDS